MSGVLGDRLVFVEWLLQRLLLESHNSEAHAVTVEHVPAPSPYKKPGPPAIISPQCVD